MQDFRDFIRDADEQSFQRDVIEASEALPVVVDFWAPWCGPCQILGPILDRLATEGAGKWRLVKVNVDENQGLSSAWQVRGVPAVKAFRKGKVIEEFVGMLPEGHVRSWLEAFVPGPADDAVAEAKAAEAEGRREEATAGYERALSLRPRFGEALLGLARLELAAGRKEEATRRLDMMMPDDVAAHEKEVAALRLELGAGGALEALEAEARARPEDLGAQVAWGKALGASGAHERALEVLLEVVRKSPRVGAGEEARMAMLDVFGAAGARSELSERFRALLASELYK